MDFYLCSTVRNLMLAIMRSVKKNHSSSLIIAITDQQGISENDFDTSVLPDHIKIVFVERKEIRKALDHRISGYVIRLMAAVGIQTTCKLRSFFWGYLNKHVFPRTLSNSADKKRLFLFNDRNRVARLLRLCFDEYEVIEDGLSNYRGLPLKTHEKIVRLLHRNACSQRCIGDDPRCKRIHLLSPENAPVDIKGKVFPINFLDADIVRAICLPFFRVSGIGDEFEFDILLATQPVSIGRLTLTNADIDIYREVLAMIREKGLRPVIKVHPRESAPRYERAFNGVPVIAGKVPLELMLFGSREPVKILSIYSSAGMGFEQFCRRLCLVRDEEAEAMAALFDSWKKEPSLLRQRILKVLEVE